MHNNVIVMDNAKYHKSLPENTPKASWKNQQPVDYFFDKGLEIEDNDLKTVIWGRIKLYIRDHVSLYL